MDIHPLDPQALDDYRAMLDLFGAVFEDPDSYCTRQPDDDYIGRLLANEHFLALVAKVDGRIVGALAGYVLPKFEQARSEFYLYDLAVDEGYRRQGVATALIGQAVELMKARGVWVMFVQADHGDDPAIALYTRLGVREDVMHFDIHMRGESP